MILHHYWRSSCSWRVRWGLLIKGISVTYQSVSLLNDDTDSPEYRKMNPMGYVPVLQWTQKGQSKPVFLSESMAILQYLEEAYPKTAALLPKDPYLRAKSRQLAEIINAGTQPLQNPNVASFHSCEPKTQINWIGHWIKEGLKAYELTLGNTQGTFSVGDQITLADLCLIPQLYNANRYEVSLAPFPRILEIQNACLSTQEAILSSPDSFKPI